MKEIWRDIKDYEGLYQVSNLGHVRSLDRTDIIGRKQVGSILKYFDNKDGYRKVFIRNNGKQKMVFIHRLVANTFIPNKDNKPQVNHKDEDKHNNYVDNLEWVTSKENNNYGTRNIRASKSNSKPIKVIYQDDTYEYWESATVFAREFGLNKSSINKVLLGQYNLAYGMKFEYLTKTERGYNNEV